MINGYHYYNNKNRERGPGLANLDGWFNIRDAHCIPRMNNKRKIDLRKLSKQLYRNCRARIYRESESNFPKKFITKSI